MADSDRWLFEPIPKPMRLGDHFLQDDFQRLDAGREAMRCADRKYPLISFDALNDFDGHPHVVDSGVGDFKAHGL